MNLIRRIEEQMRINGIKQVELSATLGISTSTLNTWIRGNVDTIPSQYIMPICDALGVTPTYLLTGESEIEQTTIQDLPESEQKLLDYFRSIDWEGQQVVIHAAIAEHRRIISNT